MAGRGSSSGAAPDARQAWGYREQRSTPKPALLESEAAASSEPASMQSQPHSRMAASEAGQAARGSATATQERLGVESGGFVGAVGVHLQEPAGQSLLQQLGDTVLQEQQPVQGTACTPHRQHDMLACLLAVHFMNAWITSGMSSEVQQAVCMAFLQWHGILLLHAQHDAHMGCELHVSEMQQS